MKTVKALILAAAAAGAATAGAADAALVITIDEVGADLVAAATGSVDTTGMRAQYSTNFTALLDASQGGIFVGPQVSTSLYLNAFAERSSFGTGAGTSAGTGAGDTLGIYGVHGWLTLPVGYVSGSALAGTKTYTNRTLATAGLNTGSYVFNLTSGDRVTVNIGGNAAPTVPEPATWGLMLAGLGMMGAGLRPRRRAAVASG